MNIIFLINKFVAGGAERYILKKALYLQRLGHGVCVVSGGGEYTAQLEKSGIAFKVIPELKENFTLLQPWDVLQLVTAVSAVVQEQQADLIEITAHNVLEVGVAAARLSRCAFLFNNFLEYVFNNRHDIRLLESCAGLGCLYTLSASIAGHMSTLSGAQLDNIRILPIPVDPAELAEREGDLGLGKELFVFVAIARLTRDKAYIGGLLDEYVRFTSRTGAGGTRLVVVGDGKYFRKYRRKAQSCNQRLAGRDNLIMMMGNRDDIGAFYRRADTYIGMGTTVLEAASYGKPVILASTYPNHKGSIGYFSKTPYESVGEVVPSQVTFSPFAELMSELYLNESLRQELAATGAAKIAEYYHIDTVMQQWCEEYSRIIDDKERMLERDLRDFVYDRQSFRMKRRKLQRLCSPGNLTGMMMDALKLRRP